MIKILLCDDALLKFSIFSKNNLKIVIRFEKKVINKTPESVDYS